VVYVGPGGQSGAYTGGSASPNGNGYIKYNDFADYVCPATVNQGLWCDPPMGRNAFYGPGFVNLDLGASKHIAIKQFGSFTLQASLFNAFNHPVFSNPVSNLNSGQAEFGKSFGTQNGSRVTQLSARYDF
jgi:hypothetical protein